MIPPGVDEMSLQPWTAICDFVRRACSVFILPMHVAIVVVGATDDVFWQRKSVAVVYGGKVNAHHQAFAMNDRVFLTLIVDGGARSLRGCLRLEHD